MMASGAPWESAAVGHLAEASGIVLLKRCVEERFMSEEHEAMWSVVDEPEQVLDAIESAPDWSEEARGFAIT